MFLQEYIKIRRIGKGAFASVYKVRHAKLGYVRALKVCDNFIEDENDRAWQTFLSECKILLRIGNGSHPNIVKIFQPHLLDNHAVVEMDCIEGESLHTYIQQNLFIPIDEFYKFASQIISALAYCHVDVYKFMMDPVEDKLTLDPNDGRKYIVSPEKEKELIKKYGVVHNDLHSGNIIKRDYDGQYILLDFGLAIQNSHCVKSSSRFDGAIEYCSPEKLENGTISTQSDIYALGILLYEMLAGRVPFPYSNGDGSTPESARSRVYQQHLQETPPPIFEFRKQAFEATHPGETYTQDYPEQLEAIIMKCLAKKPEKRFKNAKELSAAFNKLMENNSSNSSMSELNKIKEEMAELRSQLQAEKEKTKQECETETVNHRLRKEAFEAKNTDQTTWTPLEDIKNKERESSKKNGNKKSYLRRILWIAIGIAIFLYIIHCLFTHLGNMERNHHLTPAIDSTAVVENATIVLTNGHASKRNFVYTGEVDTDGLPDGQGTANYPETKSSEACIFEGSFSHGITSEGTMKFDNGNKFEGTFTDDGFYKEGTWTETDGYYFVGTFKNGDPYNGTWYTPQGNVYSKVTNGK